ncbi:MAG TPA: DUF1559 domain-containing protein [Lacipirellulaceae bacterium]|nr:DUF1559 domain-containing protein [Lacipirellulaceae bacterium]
MNRGRQRAESPGACQPAFTLVELLVVIAIIGVLVALLLPAIQAAREAARRAQCFNNLKQLGVSIHNHHSARNYFPMGMEWYDHSDQQSARLFWTFAILPYMEQNPLNNVADWSVGFAFRREEENNRLFSTPIPAYQCPSDEHGVNTAYSPQGYSRSNYVACYSPDGRMVEPSVDIAVIDGCNKLPARNPATRNALFNVDIKRGARHVTDGTSNTAAFSETITGPNGTADMRGTWWNDWGGHYTHLRLPNTHLPDNVWSAVPSLCDPAKAPCDTRAPCWTTVNFSARSNHPGGVNVARADGSVAFQSDEIDLLVWQALGSIDGEETL